MLATEVGLFTVHCDLVQNWQWDAVSASCLPVCTCLSVWALRDNSKMSWMHSYVDTCLWLLDLVWHKTAHACPGSHFRLLLFGLQLILTV